MDPMVGRLVEACGGRSFKEVSKEMGGNTDLVRKWAAGYCLPTAYNLRLFCTVTGTSADWILGLSEERELAPSEALDIEKE